MRLNHCTVLGRPDWRFHSASVLAYLFLVDCGSGEFAPASGSKLQCAMCALSLPQSLEDARFLSTSRSLGIVGMPASLHGEGLLLQLAGHDCKDQTGGEAGVLCTKMAQFSCMTSADALKHHFRVDALPLAFLFSRYETHFHVAWSLWYQSLVCSSFEHGYFAARSFY